MCPCVQGRTVCVGYMHLYAGEVRVCTTCVEKTQGLSATFRESVQSETEKWGLAGENAQA